MPKQPRATILLVDDDAGFRSSLAEGLTAAGYLVATAANGRDALEVIAGQPVDLLLTDLEMPEMGGIALLEALFHRRKGIPCLVITAFLTPELERRAYLAGAIDVVRLPVDIKGLSETIAEVGRVPEEGEIIRDLTLPGALEHLALERVTCSVKVSAEQGTALLFLRSGMLVDATTGSHRGAEACYEALGWPQPEIAIHSGGNRRPQTVTIDLEDLLLEAAQRQDKARGEVAGGGDDSQPSTRTKETLKASRRDGHRKENGMVDTDKLNAVIEQMKKELKAGLIATDVFGAKDGLSIAGHNTQPKASALFNQVTDYLVDALQGSGFPALADYYYLNLEGGVAVIVAPMGAFRVGMLVDTKKAQQGLLLNVVLPDVLSGLRAALEN